MGAQLIKYFFLAKEKVGITGQVKLAMMTKMSYETAKQAADSPENIKVFEESWFKLNQQL